MYIKDHLSIFVMDKSLINNYDVEKQIFNNDIKIYKDPMNKSLRYSLVTILIKALRIL